MELSSLLKRPLDEVQKDLKNLGRLHSVEEALKAYEVARVFFSSTSFDLIYGRQNQTIREWENELANALDLKPQHISLYQLTIEPGTPFFFITGEKPTTWFAK